MHLRKIITAYGLSFFLAVTPGLAIAAENAVLLDSFKQNIEAQKQIQDAAAGQEGGGAVGGLGDGTRTLVGIAIAAAIAVALAALFADDSTTTSTSTSSSTSTSTSSSTSTSTTSVTN